MPRKSIRDNKNKAEVKPKQKPVPAKKAISKPKPKWAKK